MLIENSKGGYSFLKGSAPYSAGVVASRGFRIDHARLSKPLPIAAAFERIDAHLKALCAMELRSPNPVARTNVAPEIAPPSEPVITTVFGSA